MIGTCPYDHPFVDPNGNLKKEDRSFLECSGQGKCNRANGICDCFKGYEGTACQRQSCPNYCNGHGVCTAVNLMKITENQLTKQYTYDPTTNADYDYWDRDQSFACVCDAEWTGYDCSQRKCPVGYASASDCDEATQSTQIFKIPLTSIGKKAYLEYEDPYGRFWYSDLINDITDKEQWKNELYKFPTGTIDISEVTSSTDSQYNIISVKFGSHQTGKQPQIQILEKSKLTNDEKFKTTTVSLPGYHGIIASYADTIENIIVENNGIDPLVCSGNGICDFSSGLCVCFEGYYGVACNKKAAYM